MFINIQTGISVDFPPYFSTGDNVVMFRSHEYAQPLEYINTCKHFHIVINGCLRVFRRLSSAAARDGHCVDCKEEEVFDEKQAGTPYLCTSAFTQDKLFTIII